MDGDLDDTEEQICYMESPLMNDSVYIRIALPGHNLQRCMQFHLDDTIWHGKRVVLHTIAKEYKDGLNYGFYLPPMNGRAGKFLEEERLFREYPLPGPIGYLEFRYKRRMYRSMNINQSKMKKLHSKSNLKLFIEHIRNGQLDKLSRLLHKGLDPNFQFGESGETPLTLASSMPSSGSIILSLVNNGAHLDYRNKHGLTPVHVAAIKSNHGAMRVLLDLGASPNYRDARELTAIYHVVSCETSSSYVMELLLRERAILGTTDMNGSTEIHQACRYGRVQHLEHLLFYAADMNVQNNGGNTPLHICAVNNQESCARVLLFRGCQKEIENYAHQTPAQVAAIAGNIDLVDIINRHTEDDVVPFRESPTYNEKRRSISSIRALQLQQQKQRPRSPNRPNPGRHPSPAARQARTPDYDVTTSATAMSMQRSHSAPGVNFDGSNAGGESFLHLPHVTDAGRMSSVGSDVFDLSDHCSLVGDSESPPSLSLYSSGSRRSSLDYGSVYSSSKRRLYAALPGRVFICIRSYQPVDEDELELKKGEFVDVLSVGEKGFWEGRCGRREGWFPHQCVEEVKVRDQEGGRHDNDTVMIRRNTLTALIMAEDCHYLPRTVVLVKGKKGFGFVLKGAKGNLRSSSSMDFLPSPSQPALQYIDKIDAGSVSEKAGLKNGDFLLEVNGEIVVSATHDHVVELIRKCGQMLALKVITVRDCSLNEYGLPTRQSSTLPRQSKSQVLSTSVPPPAPPKRHPDTQLSLGRARSRSIAEGLAHLEELDKTLAEYDTASLAPSEFHRSMDDVTLRQKQPASIRSRPSSTTIRPEELQELFTRNAPPAYVNVEISAANLDKPVVNNVPRTYASPAELKAESARRKAEKLQSNSFMVRTQSTPNLAKFDDSGVDDWRNSLGDEDPAFHSPSSGYPSPLSPDSGLQINQTNVDHHIYNAQNRPVRSWASPAERRRRNNSTTLAPKLDTPDVRTPVEPKTEMVPIATKKPENIYLSPRSPEEIYMVPRSDVDFESSFRPGTDAKFSTAPAFKAQQRPPLHERIYSIPPTMDQIYATPHRHGNPTAASPYAQAVVSRRGDVTTHQNGVYYSGDVVTNQRVAITTASAHLLRDVRRHNDANVRHHDVPTSREGVPVLNECDVDEDQDSVPYIPAPDYDRQTETETVRRNSQQYATYSTAHNPHTMAPTAHTMAPTAKTMVPTAHTMAPSAQTTAPSIHSALLDRQVRLGYRSETKSANSLNVELAVANRASRTSYRSESKTPNVPLTMPGAGSPQTTPTAQPTNNSSVSTRATPNNITTHQFNNDNGGTTPVYHTTNGDTNTTPSRLDTTHSRLDTTPSRLHTTPSRLDTTPSRLDTTPSGLDTTPNRLEKTVSADSRRDSAVTVSDLQNALKKRDARMSAKPTVDETVESARVSSATQAKSGKDFGSDIREAVQRRRELMERKKTSDGNGLQPALKTEKVVTVNNNNVKQDVDSTNTSGPIIATKSLSDSPSMRVINSAKSTRNSEMMNNAKNVKNNMANGGPVPVPSPVKPTGDTLKLMAALRASLRTKKIEAPVKLPVNKVEKATPNGVCINGIHVMNGDTNDSQKVTREKSFTARAERLRQEYLLKKKRDSMASTDSLCDKPSSGGQQNQSAYYTVSSTGNNCAVLPPPPNYINAEDLTDIVIPPPPDYDNRDDSQSVRSSQSTISTPSSGFQDALSDHSLPTSLTSSAMDIIFAGEYNDGLDSIPYFLPPAEFTDSGQHSPHTDTDQESVNTLISFSFNEKPIDSWTNRDVADWLDSLHLKEYSKNFLQHDIDGSCLVLMTRTDFMDIGVTRVGHRMTMERSIKQLSVANKSEVVHL